MLLNSTKDIQEYFGTLHSATSWKILKPFVTQAQGKYLRPALGPQILELLQAGITEVDGKVSMVSLTAKSKLLYEIIAGSLTYYAVLEAMPFMNISLGNNGMQETATQGLTPARQWVYLENMKAAADNADRLLDDALLYLEANAADFPAWLNSEAYTISKELFLSNTTDFNRYIRINGSRRAFLAFRNYIDRAEQLYILPILGADLFRDLKTKILNPATLQEADRKIISLIKPALAQLALKEALPEISIEISATGLKVLSVNDSIRSSSAAKESQLSALEVKAIQLIDVYVAELKRHLDTVLQPGELTPDQNKQTWEAPDNTGSQSFWI